MGGGGETDKSERNRCWRRLYPRGDDDAGDDGDERAVRCAGLPARGDGVREDGGEEGRGGADGLVEGDGEVAEGDVPGDDGGAEDGAEHGDPGELAPGAAAGGRGGGGGGGARARARGVGEGGEERAGGHVAGGEEDGEAEAVDGEEVLVEEEHPDVGGVPRRHQPRRDEPGGRGRRRGGGGAGGVRGGGGRGERVVVVRLQTHLGTGPGCDGGRGRRVVEDGTGEPAGDGEWPAAAGAAGLWEGLRVTAAD